MKAFVLLPLAMCLVQSQAFVQAQAPIAQPPRPMSPILKALDLKGDGILDAGEIVRSPQSLKTLDANGDGQLTPDEYRPPRPDGKAQPAQSPRPQGERPPQKLERPRPLLDTVLDEDGDEVISTQEMARASSLLKKLDRNGDGRLSRDEYDPKPSGSRPNAPVPPMD